jgi:hypothetical protein
VAGVLCALAWVVAGAAGCGDRCDDLQQVCERCRDPNERGRCEDTVRSGDQTTCDNVTREYEDVCPE